jgi:DNA-binding CsgD family transcriptional regulator
MPALGLADWPRSILDELDHGIVLLGPDQHLVLMNRAAEAALAGTRAIALQSRQLCARSALDTVRLVDALHAAAERGLRRLLTLGSGSERISLAVVPLGDERHARPCATMILFGKHRVCEQLSMQWYAHAHGLTSAETRVLARLASGESPREIAAAHDVGLATVRTQIGAIRVKTGAASIRDLLQQVAVLPPMVGRLRSG